MKLGSVYGFEKAGWPAFLVDKRGVIAGSNSAAAQTFGASLQGGSVRLTQIWSPENEFGAEAFLEKWQKQPAASIALKFNVRGLQVSYTTVLCTIDQEGESFIVFQLFPDLGSGIGASDKPVERPTRGLEETMQKNKLEIALQLTRSVALDFNNALAGVMGHSSLLLMQTPPDHPWRKSLQEIERAAEKAAGISNSLRAFSRAEREALGPAEGNLNVLIEKVVQALRGGNPQIQWHLQFEPRLFLAKFDDAKLEGAFSRIFENAVQAIPAGGAITVTTRNLDLEAPTQDRDTRLAPGPYVCTEIADTGCGIETEFLPRIFEPFFTTKEKSRHRGLGLAWAYGVITNHRGGIAVSSKSGVGTSVRVYLPAEKRIVEDDQPMPADLKGTETILLVDDEDLVLNLGKTVLETYGYRVITATSGQMALGLFSDPAFKPDLLVTDQVMPGMSGVQLVEAVRRIAPQLPVLFISGNLTQDSPSKLTSLPKPFTSSALLVRVRQVLRSVQQ